MTERSPSWNARGPALTGLAALGLLIFGIGAWSVGTRIEGAVLAPGTVKVETNRQIVQHDEGGIVGQILHRDGATVRAGDVLIRLDDSALQAEATALRRQIVELAARRSRLEAETAGTGVPVFPPELVLLARSDAGAADQIRGQSMLFHARKETQSSELAQMDERIRQTRNQIEGASAELNALKQQARLVGEELEDQVTLLDRGLIQKTRVVQLERQSHQLSGAVGRMTSEIARLRGEIASFEIEKVRLIAARREHAIESLRDIRVRETEVTRQLLTITTRLARTEIRAPAAGVLHGATVFSKGAVIRPAETLMYVVPQDRPLIVSSRIDAGSIDQVRVGQPVSLRFPGLNQRVTPMIPGTTIGVSPDTLRDDVSGRSYYAVEIEPDATDLAALEGVTLLPGMPVEVHIRTDARTPLSYVTKPFRDYFARALKDG